MTEVAAALLGAIHQYEPSTGVQAGLIIALALVVDRCFGEPALRWHPVVWMGHGLQMAQKWVFAGGAHTQKDEPKLRLFWRGAAAWWLMALGWGTLAWGLQWLVGPAPWWLRVPLLALCLKPFFAWSLLVAEVKMVGDRVQVSLDGGRAQLSRIVSRDTTVLTASQVQESAVESLAENLNDSVIAPLFWFLILGLPGAVMYRFANTADAMWGYPGMRSGVNWAWAGKWAARADDVLSAIPARITAVLLLFCGAWCLPSSALASSTSEQAISSSVWRRAFSLRKEARKTPSPNSGWPMAAMALVLNVVLSKPQVYSLHPSGNPVDAAALQAAIRVANTVVITAFLGYAAAVALTVFW